MKESDIDSQYAYYIGRYNNNIFSIIKAHIKSSFPTSKIIFKEATYPILQNRTPLVLALIIVAMECDALPGRMQGISSSFT